MSVIQTKEHQRVLVVRDGHSGETPGLEELHFELS